MATSLRSKFEGLAKEFAAALLAALRDLPLDDLVSGRAKVSSHSAGRGARKRIRRSPAELESFAAKIVAAVKRHPKGIRAEDLKRAMGVQSGNVGAKVFTKPLAVALKSKRITKRGHRRATRYYAK